jgi:hypothetical protein
VITRAGLDFLEGRNFFRPEFELRSLQSVYMVGACNDLISGMIPAFVSRVGGTPRKSAIRIAGHRAEI